MTYTLKRKETLLGFNKDKKYDKCKTKNSILSFHCIKQTMFDNQKYGKNNCSKCIETGTKLFLHRESKLLSNKNGF